ncbi:MAG: FMN-binding protein [Actinomycetota bacterium]
MRRVVLVFMSTITTVMLLLGYHTSTNSTFLASSRMVQTPAATDPAPSSRASSGGGSSSAKSSPAAAAVSYTGGVADTRWGPVQVQITVRGGKITRSRAVQYPQGTNVDAQINSYALPILDQEVVQKQSVSIDAISGATVTSDGYLQSLQSAIDQAHL